jgi:hypothetical protein
VAEAFLLNAPTIKSLHKALLQGDDLLGSGTADIIDSPPGSTQTDADNAWSSTTEAFVATDAGEAAPSPLHAASLLVDGTADDVINAAESAVVSFTVRGLAAGGAGTVTFTDASNHQVVVDIGGDGTYSANLSVLTDGNITSALSARDSAGATATANGNSVSLDTDKDLNPAITVNAANPANVKFTISGFEGDETGTMTFTDSTGRQDVVNVGSNGTYSADLSNLANGTLTYLLSETDAAGNTINVDPTATLGDGSANAPAGTPQAPTLLNGYAVRPAWMVAGVDYAVGIPSGTTLKNPLTINMAGVSVDSAHALIRVTGNGVVLSGYDFTGWTVYINGGAQNTTVQNSNFSGGADVFADPTTSNVSVLYCNFDGIGSTGSAFVILSGTGTKTVEYNWMKNSPQHFLELNNGGAVTYSFNLIENGGEAAGAHLNVIQFQGGATGASYNNPVISYNTIYQTLQLAGGELVQTYDQGGAVTNALVSNNTMIAVPGPGGTASVSYLVDAAIYQGYATSGTIQNNYMADAGGGAYGFFYPMGSNTANYTLSNNIDLATGKVIQIDNSEITTSSITSIVDSPASGDLNLGKTVTLTLNFAAAMTVAGGVPTLTLNDGGTATYTGGSGTSALTFSYTVGSGQNTAGLSATAVNLNGATVKDAGGTSANLSLTGLTQTGPQIDTTIPTVTQAIASPGSGIEYPGNTITLTLVMSETVIVTGTPTLSLNDGGTATYLAGTGTNALTFVYTVGSSDQTVSALAITQINLPSGATVKDGAGNAANLSGALTTFSGLGIDPPGTAPPAINSFSPDSGTVGDGITNVNVLTLAGTAAANSTVTVFDGATQLGAVTANASGAWSYVTPVLANGNNAFTATDTVAGTTSGASAAFNVTVDTHTPAAPVISGDAVSTSNVVTLTGTAEANSTVTVFNGATQLGTATTNGSGAWSFATASLANGSYSFKATATDVAGTTSAASAPLPLTLNTPQNLVVNGSFEAGSFAGWTRGGNFYSGSTAIITKAESGVYAAGLGATGSDGTLSQSIQTGQCICAKLHAV